jgi:4a-hydroxytetrahydrobiopterin dehydratase
MDKKEIDQKITELSGDWQLADSGALTKILPFTSFDDAINYINKMAEVAEKLNHHPDFEVSRGKLTIRLLTHSINALTEKDLELADALDELDSALLG